MLFSKCFFDIFIHIWLPIIISKWALKISGYIYFFGESDTLGVGSAFWSREFSSLKPNVIAWVDKQAQTSQELLSD